MRHAIEVLFVAVLGALVGLCLVELRLERIATVTHQACLDDCEATGRGLWAWRPTSCECTP